jgi:uncharacterized protein HemX
VSDDHERLLAEALRAKAASEGPTQARPQRSPARKSAAPLRWLALIAVLLGLAAGAVTGLLTQL